MDVCGIQIGEILVRKSYYSTVFFVDAYQQNLFKDEYKEKSQSISIFI